MDHRFDGILLIDKETGETSYDVVRKVKSALGRSNVFKVGHAGTLDPFATGLLIILLGQGTKLSRFLTAENKVYRGIITLGVETDTLDPTGRVIKCTKVPRFDLEHIRKVAQSFVGEIEQVPPAFSAVRYKGKRAYHLARKGLEINLRQRTVVIHAFRVLSVMLPDVTVEIHCSSGTYVRSLAAALGGKLGTVGCLKSLRRLVSGVFKVTEALKSSEISFSRIKDIMDERLIPLGAALPNMRQIELDDSLVKKIRNGHQPAIKELVGGAEWTQFETEPVKLVKRGKLVAIVEPWGSGRNADCTVKLSRVFF